MSPEAAQPYLHTVQFSSVSSPLPGCFMADAAAWNV